jgi:hypothetical protein
MLTIHYSNSVGTLAGVLAGVISEPRRGLCAPCLLRGVPGNPCQQAKATRCVA